MSYLLDTNIVSEVRKGSRCDPRVARWYKLVHAEDLFLSVLVVGEIRKGVEMARRVDPARASRFEEWLETIETEFGARILGVNNAVAHRWGHLSAMRSVSIIDGLMAATAITYGLTLVTRNDRDVAGLGAATLNPFRSGTN